MKQFPHKPARQKTSAERQRIAFRKQLHEAQDGYFARMRQTMQGVQERRQETQGEK